MPQNNYLPLARADYPLTRPYQKPGGVTVSTAITATYVPNKAPQPGGGVLAAEGREREPALRNSARTRK